MTSILSMGEISILDRQIQQLHDYKPIAENEVKNLCEKVSNSPGLVQASQCAGPWITRNRPGLIACCFFSESLNV